VLCGVVEPSNISQSNSRLRCVDSQTSSTRGEWPEPEDGYRKPPPPPIIISNDGYHPGSIKFQKIKYDETNFEWKRASVCGSLKFAGFSSLDSLLSFECVCDRTCGMPKDNEDNELEFAQNEIGRCVNRKCLRCQDGWSSRGDFTMLTDCVVYEPVQTLFWGCVIITSLVTLFFSGRRSYDLFRLRSIWRSYYSTVSDDQKDAVTGVVDEDYAASPVGTATLHCQDVFYLVWKHDDGIFLVLSILRSFVLLFFVALPKVSIGQGSEIGMHRVITASYAVSSAIEIIQVPEIILMTLTKWAHKLLPRRNPYRLHVVLELHKALDWSYNTIRPLLMMVAFSAPMCMLLVNLAHCNGTFGDSLETRIIPFAEQHTLAVLLSILMRGQYLALASLQFWVAFQLFGRLLYKFNTFAVKVRRACHGVHDEENAKDYRNNISNPEQTLEHIGVAVAATRKLAMLILFFSSCLSGYYTLVIMFEWMRVRVSFVVAPFVLLVDVLTIELVYKVKPLPRRLNETKSARRYIKVGDGLGGVTGEEGTFDARVGDSVFAAKNDDDDDGEEHADGRGVFSCCVSKSSKQTKRREKKKRRRQQLRAAAVESAKVAPVKDQQQDQQDQQQIMVTRTTKTGDKVPVEDPKLYLAHGVDDTLRRRFKLEFVKIDKDGSESIDFHEFVSYYTIAENASFVKRLFASFQSLIPWSRPKPNKDGEFVLYFQDYVLGLRQFLAMTKGELILKAFELYDDDCSMSLDILELREMVMDIWGNHASIESSRIQYIITQMDPDKSGDCDMWEWMASCKKNPVLMKPAFNCQRMLREKCFGTKFWEKMVKSDIEFKNSMKAKGGKTPTKENYSLSMKANDSFWDK